LYDLVAADISLGGDDIDGDDGLAGGIEIVGDDLMVGADPRAMAARRAAANRPHNKVRLARVQPANQTQPINFPQGPNGTTIFPGSTTANLLARPQRVMQVGRFVVPSFIAPFFAIGDLVVGRDSMFGNAEFASAEIFAQNGFGVSLKGFIARPGIDITLNVQNLDTADHKFFASLIGPALV